MSIVDGHPLTFALDAVLEIQVYENWSNDNESVRYAANGYEVLSKFEGT